MQRYRIRPDEYGFSYVALLILIALIGAIAAAAMSVGAVAQRRESEQELLFIGRQFQRAFESYRNATAIGSPPFPERLEELIRDTRGPVVRRHLRKIYFDPLTGKREWGIRYAPGGRITRVFSLADGRPIKIAEFPAEFESFEGKASYSEWEFGALLTSVETNMTGKRNAQSNSSASRY